MPLLDDLLRMFGTNRVKLRWKWDAWKKRIARRAPRPGQPAPVKIQYKPFKKRPLGWLIPSDFPIGTALFMAANIALYFVVVKVSHDQYPDQVGGSFKPAPYALIRFGADFSPFVEAFGEYWRLVTANFLHFDVMHILFNTIGLWTAGTIIEERFGRPRFLVLYVVTAVAGATLSYWRHRAGGFLGAGASTAVFGLIAFVAVHALVRRTPGTSDLRERFVGWLIYGVIFSFLPKVDFWGHLGGAIAGAALAMVVSDKRSQRKPWLPEPVWWALATGCLGVVAWAFWMCARTPFDPAVFQ